MPKLLVFAPCEKVIISQDENNPTLIAILSSLGLQAEADELTKAIGPETAELVMVPIRWSIFSMWLREESDGSREFTQTVDIESPAGKSVISHRVSFSFNPNVNTHRINLNFAGFPVREQGVYLLRLTLDGKAITDYPLELKLLGASAPRPVTQ